MKHEIGITTARNGLRLRDSPRDGSTLAVLPKGTHITIKGRETWVRVSVAGQEGYVLADYVEPPPEGSAEIEEFSSSRMRGEVIRIPYAPCV